MVNPFSKPITVVVAISAIVAVVLTLAFDEGVQGNDYAQMVSVARNLTEGSGLKTDLIYYDVHYAIGGSTVPQTVFPPGQAVLVAMAGYLGVPAHVGALFWCVTAFILTAIAIALALRESGAGRLTIMSASAVWLCMGVNWTNVLALRSESLLVATTSLGALFLARSSSHGRFRRREIFLLSCAAASALLFRYQGLFFIASVGLYFGVRLLILRDRGAFVDLIVACLVPGLVTVSLFAYNLSVTGAVGGGPVDQAAMSTPIPAVALGYYYEISKVLGVSKDGLMAGGLSEIFAIALFVYLLSLLVTGSRSDIRVTETIRRPLFVFCVTYTMISAAAFVYLSITKSTGYTQARYLSTLLPFVIIPVALLAEAAMSGSRGASWRQWAGIVLLAGFVVFGQFRATNEALQGLAADSRLRQIQESLRSHHYEGDTMENFLRREIDIGRNVLANQSQIVGYLLERPTYGLTPSLYTRRKFDIHEVQKMTAEHSLAYLVLFPMLYDGAAIQNRNRIILTELHEGRVPDSFVPITQSQKLHVYRINQNGQQHAR